MAPKTLTVEHRKVLWACFAYWKASDHLPETERGVCYEHVIDPYRDRFGETFHQSQLGVLKRAGLLTADRLVRGGGRRYYRLPDPVVVRELVTDFDQPSQV